jgi:hypothetical protein
MPGTELSSSTVPRRGGSLAICLFVLIVTAGAVYVRQWRNAGPLRESSEPLSATVVVRWPAEYRATSAARPIVAPDPVLLRAELTSAANVRRALEGSPALPTPAVAGDGMAALVEEFRVKLQVAAQSTPGNNEVRVAIACAADGSHAAAVVNGLAQHYADQCHVKLQTDAQQVLDAARAAHRRARQQMVAAKAAVDDYLAIAARQRATADAAAPPIEGPANQASAPGRELRLTANPEWTRLNEQVQSLRARRTELLAVRTPAHPEIQDLDSRIAQAEQRLANTRRQIVDQPADLPVVINGSTHSPLRQRNALADNAPPPPKRPAENPEATEAYRKLNDALVQANAAEEQAAAAETQARHEQEQLPLIEVFAANVVAATAPQFHAWLQPLQLSLAAGLAMAFGTGLLLRGMPRARTFATASQIHSALSLPVVGVLHETGLAVIGGRTVLNAAASLLCLALGIVLVAGCGVLLTGQIDHLASYLPWDLNSVTDPLRRFVEILSQKP